MPRLRLTTGSSYDVFSFSLHQVFQLVELLNIAGSGVFRGKQRARDEVNVLTCLDRDRSLLPGVQQACDDCLR